MPTPIIPQLGRSGFVSNKNEILTLVYSYFMAGKRSQSVMFKDTVPSLDYIINTYTNRDEWVDVIISTLTDELVPNYFSSATVNVDVTDNKGVDLITIDITAVSGTTTTTLSKKMEVRGNDIFPIN